MLLLLLLLFEEQQDPLPAEETKRIRSTSSCFVCLLFERARENRRVSFQRDPETPRSKDACFPSVTPLYS